MEMKNLEKAMDIYARLVTGEDVGRSGANASLYEDYYGNAEVYEILSVMLKKLNLHIYEYKESLFLSPGDGNRVFGYTNEEMKRAMGLRYNRELYLAYFIIYEILLLFYSLMLVINSLNAFCPFSFLLNTPASSRTSRKTLPISCSRIALAFSLLKSG